MIASLVNRRKIFEAALQGDLPSSKSREYITSLSKFWGNLNGSGLLSRIGMPQMLRFLSLWNVALAAKNHKCICNADMMVKLFLVCKMGMGSLALLGMSLRGTTMSFQIL